MRRPFLTGLAVGTVATAGIMVGSILIQIKRVIRA